jgi:integrase
MALHHKRSNGEGSLFWDDSRERWVVQLTVPDGTRKKRTAKTRREANRLLTEMLNDLEVNGGVFDQKSRFADLSSLWREKVLMAKAMAPKTRDVKTWALDRLDDELSTVKLVDLNVDRIEKALGAMAAEGLGKGSLIKVRSVMNQVCAFGERRDLLRKNPVPVVELPAGLAKPNEGRALTIDQARALLAESASNRLNGLLATMLMLGLRPGEAAALHWSDIDLDGQKLHVRQNLRKVDGGFEITDELKTAKSRRSLTMPHPLVEALHRHREVQDSERETAGEAWDLGWPDLAFTSLVGTPLDPSNVRREFKELTNSAGLGDWSPNELRHSCVSILSSLGVPLEEIADVMGHDGTRMTSTVYRHINTPSIGAAAGPMEDAFGRT